MIAIISTTTFDCYMTLIVIMITTMVQTAYILDLANSLTHECNGER